MTDSKSMADSGNDKEQSAREIELRSRLFQETLNLSNDPTFFVDNQDRIRFWNQAAEDVLGVSTDELANSSKAHTVVLQNEPEIANIEAGNAYRKPSRIVDPIQIGDQVWRRVVLKPASLVADSKQEELYRLAQTDHLSNLLNRRGFQTALESSLHLPLCLAIVDIDNFKSINDEYGHEAGDNVIRYIADSLESFFSNAICIGRLGGDEFGVVLHSNDNKSIEESFDSICELVNADPNSTFAFPVSVSIGVANSAKATTARELLTRADKAMYQSKRNGKNRVTVVSI